MTDHEEILYRQQGTDGFFLYMNGIRPVSTHMGLLPDHVLLKREHAFLCVRRKQSKNIINWRKKSRLFTVLYFSIRPSRSKTPTPAPSVLTVRYYALYLGKIGCCEQSIKRAVSGLVQIASPFPYIAKFVSVESRGGEGERRGLGPRNDVLTTCKAVTLRGGHPWRPRGR